MPMRNLLFITLFASAAAFAPRISSTPSIDTVLHLQRRDVIMTGIAGLLSQPAIASATGSTFFFDEKIEFVREESQMKTGGKIDLNNAFVSEYKMLPGMFPHAAGKIASHGPYLSVRDIYKIPNLTDNDKQVFKRYEKLFTANPPGRAFHERINQRFST